MAVLAAALCAAAAGAGFDLTEYTPMTVTAPSGNEGSSVPLELYVPTKPGEHQLADPATLYEFVQDGWDKVVEENQAGLSSPQEQHRKAPPLAKEEAWHHYQAAHDGVVDSARFLTTFTMIPTVQTGGSALFLAAAKGDAAGVKALLEDGDNVNEEKVSDGNTALHAAAVMCQKEAAKVLLEYGGNPNAAGLSGATPLMMAASMGCTDVAEVLLADADTQVDYRHPFVGNTALHFAVEMGRVDVVKQLCDAGADPAAMKSKTDGTPLHTAADTNQSLAADALLTHCAAAAGYSENRKKGYLNQLMMKDTTPLYLASQRGFTEVMKVLIAHGAEINFVMPTGTYRSEVIASKSDGGPSKYYESKNDEVGNGATALHAATENNQPAAVAILLAHGAKQQSTMQGTSPLLNAVQYKRDKIAFLLMKHLTDDIKSNGGVGRVPENSQATPLSECVRFGTDWCYALAVEMKNHMPRYFKAQTRFRTQRGETPLTWALMRRDNRFISLLLLHGGIAENAEEFALLLMAAIEGGDVQAVAAVLAHRPKELAFDIDTAFGKDMTTADANLLHHAIVRRKPVAFIRHVVEHFGASPTATVRSSKATVTHLAAQRGDVDVLEYVLSLPGVTLEPEGGRSIHWATPLYMAAQHGNDAVVEYILKHGAKRYDAPLFKLNVTPLYVAAQLGRVKVFEALRAHGANVKQKDADGRSMLAVTQNQAIYDALVAAGVERCDMEVLVSQLEAEQRSEAILKDILSACAGERMFELRRADGYGALHAAAEGGPPSDPRNSRMQAARDARALELVKLLRSNNAPLGRPTDQAATPAMLAAKAGLPKTLAFLLSAGDAVRNAQSTLVHAAVEGSVEGAGCPVCRAIRSSDVDLTMEDASGASAEAAFKALLSAGPKGRAGGEKAAPPPLSDKERTAQRKKEFKERQRQAREEERGGEL